MNRIKRIILTKRFKSAIDRDLDDHPWGMDEPLAGLALRSLTSAPNIPITKNSELNMTTNPSALYGAGVWMRREASENPHSICARVLPGSIEPIAHRLEIECPNASEQEMADWLTDFEKRYSQHFSKSHGDLSGLSGDQKLAIINGEDDPYGILRKRKSRK